MNYTDGFILVFFFLFFYGGWRKGFLRSILGPISLFLGILLSYVHYSQNEDLIIAVLISVFAPFVLHLVLGFLLKMIQRNNKEDEKDSGLSTFSQILGGVFRLVWQGTMLILVLLLITLIPFNFSYLGKVQANIQNSRFFEIIHSWTGNKIPAETLDMQSLQKALQNPETVEEVRKTKPYQNLMNNQQIQEILKDEEILNELKNKNILALMKNKKIQTLMEDENLLKEIFALQKEIIKKASDK